MADGNLTFDTKIDTSGFEKGITTLETVIEKLSKSIDELSINIKNAFENVDTTKQTKGMGITTDAINETDSAARRMEESMKNVDAAIERMKAQATNVDIIPETEQKIVDETTQAVNETTQAMEKLEDTASGALDQSDSDASGLGNTFNFIKQTVADMPSIFKNIADSITNVFVNSGNSADSANSKIQLLVDEIDTLKDHLAALEKKGMYFGDKEYDEAYSSLKKAEHGLSEYKKSLADVNAQQEKTKKSTNKMTKSMNGANRSGKKYNKTLGMLKNSLMIMMAFKAINTVFNGVKEGMENLAQYSPRVNANLSLLMSSLTQLKNALATAFAPILNIITPILNSFIQLLVRVCNAVAQFFSLIGGKSTYTKASKVQQDYADSLKTTGKQAKKTAKDVKKSMASIDDVTILTDNSSKDSPSGSGANELSPSDMFEESPISSKMKEFVDVFKAEMATLFEPIQAAWNKYGQGTMEAFDYALDSILSVIAQIYKSFKEVWTGGSGEEVVSNILQIFTNIFNIIGNIATAFKDAWIKDDTGTKIIQDMFNILNNFLGLIKDVTKATSDWSKKLDLSPILTAFQNLTSSVEPLTSTIADGLSWFYSNVLLPLASYTITNLIPLFLDGLSAALDIINGVITALQPLALWLFDNFLKPLAEWTGGLIADILGTIVEKLQSFADWINENQTVVENMAIAIGSFLLAWKIVDIATTIAGIVGALVTFIATGGLATVVAGLLSVAIGFLTSPITIAIAIIGALIAVGVLLYKNWDTVKEKAIKIWDAIKDYLSDTCTKIKEFFTTLWTNIKTTFSNVGTWFKEKFKLAYDAVINIFKGIGTWFGARWTDIKTAFSVTVSWFKDIFTKAWSGIKTAFSLSSIKSFFADIWTGIKSCFSSVTSWFKDTFSKAWKAVKDVFSTGGKIFDGIKDGIASTFKTVVNGLIKGINKIISTPFNLINGMLNSIRNVSVLGMTPFSGLWSQNPISVPQIPRLATGTVVPANYGNFLATLGDNKREVEVVSPLSTMKQAFKDAMKETGGNGGNINLTVNLDGQKVYQTVVKYNNQNTRRTGNNALAY